MTEFTVEELMEKMAKEIGRLQQLCRDNGIDPLPPLAPTNGLNVSAEVKVFKTKKEAEEYQKSFNSHIK